jgi:hypothetical protein
MWLVFAMRLFLFCLDMTYDTPMSSFAFCVSSLTYILMKLICLVS